MLLRYFYDKKLITKYYKSCYNMKGFMQGMVSLLPAASALL